MQPAGNSQTVPLLVVSNSVTGGRRVRGARTIQATGSAVSATSLFSAMTLQPQQSVPTLREYGTMIHALCRDV